MLEKDKKLRCSEGDLAKIADLARTDDLKALALTDDLISEFPTDPMLRFLRGSLLAGERRYAEAEAAMTDAITLDPEFKIARFQLGLLQFSSGDTSAAANTWTLLHHLTDDDPLRLFAIGLEHLSRNEWILTLDFLSKGIALNVENGALNRNISIIVNEVKDKILAKDSDRMHNSVTSLLMGMDGALKTRH